ncbi:hypothetical protein [Mycoplasmopsis lipofaciens]|uniref:hypothetical protein n=1 Tax=Mycoplasmopsis lipofaciens TaxID=114884 RepID=UPI00048737DF|nr:hypothetical protein [Mycoplasmopsis lipofaciens]
MQKYWVCEKCNNKNKLNNNWFKRNDAKYYVICNNKKCNFQTKIAIININCDSNFLDNPNIKNYLENRITISFVNLFKMWTNYILNEFLPLLISCCIFFYIVFFISYKSIEIFKIEGRSNIISIYGIFISLAIPASISVYRFTKYIIHLNPYLIFKIQKIIEKNYLILNVKFNKINSTNVENEIEKQIKNKAGIYLGIIKNNVFALKPKIKKKKSTYWKHKLNNKFIIWKYKKVNKCRFQIYFE